MEGVEFLGHIIISQTHTKKEAPKQKITSILQYKKTNFIVVCMSYGYVAVINIDPVGQSDVSHSK